MPIQSLSADTATDDIVAAIQADGVVILERLFDESLVDAVHAEALPILERENTGGGDFLANRTKTIHAPMVNLPSFRQMVVNPKFLEIGDRILGPNCEQWTYSATSLLAVQPEGQGNTQMLHRDDLNYPYIDRTPGRPHVVMTVMFNITDFTAENGATRFVPGSHLWKEDREPKPEEIEQAIMPRGSLAVWVGATLHGFGDNRSSEQRIGIPMTNVVSWLRQEENLIISVPPEVARECPEVLIQKLGYAQQGLAIGTAPGRNPKNFLAEA